MDYSGNQALYNQVNYRDHTDACFKHVNGKLVKYYRHSLRSTGMAFLLTNNDAVGAHGFPYAYCHFYAKGTFEKSSGSDIDFSGGVSAPYLNLSAEAKYSHDTTVTWSIPSAGAMLCGSNSSGFNSAPYGGSEKYVPCGAAASSSTLPADGTVEPSC